MGLIVQKYGGTSVGSVERIKAVADRVVMSRAAGNDIIAVVSAMAGETNRLFAIANELCDAPDLRETDVLVATGEQVSAALLAIRLQAMGQPAVSFLAHQLRIFTDSNHGRARIKSIDSKAVLQALKQRNIVVVAGYQGVDAKGDITTLGRGASDLTAVALAAALKADLCEIYTDVDGVYTADPHLCPQARKLDRISYDEMLELAGLGAKVLQNRSVEVAKRFNVPLMVRSSFSELRGLGWDKKINRWKSSGRGRDAGPEREQDYAERGRGPAGAGGEDFRADRRRGNSRGHDHPERQRRRPHGHDLHRARAATLSGRSTWSRRSPREIGARGVRHEDQVAKVSIVGCGMRTHAGVAARMFEVLAGGADQHRDDRHFGDQGLGRGERQVRRAGGARAARRFLGARRCCTRRPKAS